MSRTYKMWIFILFLLISGAILLYFSPVSTKEIKVEEKKELASENNVEPDKEEAPPDKNNENNNTEENSSLASEEKANETAKNETSLDSIKIIQKLVSWGYSKPQSARTIDTIIIHSSYNALGGDKYDLTKLLEEYREYGVSPHYLIDREGNIYQLVSDKNIAYHAGESQMPDGRTNVNNFSLGIEIMNTEDSNLTEKQYQSLNKLMDYLKNIHKIKDVLGHNQISSGRKTDPWNFDWKKI